MSIGEQKYTDDLRHLHCALIAQRIDAISIKTSDAYLLIRLDYLAEQAQAISIGQSVNLGKLSDMRFGSLFGSAKKPAAQIRSMPLAPDRHSSLPPAIRGSSLRLL